MNPEELQKQLDALKLALETAITAKAKKETEDQIKALEAKLAEAQKDVPDTKKIETELTQTKDTLKKIQDANVIRDEADRKNQKALDDMIASQKERKTEPKESKSFGQRLLEGMKENGDKLRDLKKGDRVMLEMFTPEEQKAAADMDFATNFPTARVTNAYLRPDIIELPKRKLHIRQLLQGGGMDSKSTFNFVKETTTTGAPLPAAEGALKEEIALNLVESAVQAQWIAAFIRISRNMLDDVTGMTTFLQSRLPELLLRAEDNQLLNGSGVSPNLSGITHAGNFTAATSTKTIDWEQVIESIAQLEGYDREANGILVHPSNYWKMPLYKGTSHSMYSQPAIVNISMDQGILRIGGVPVFRSTAAAAGQFIIGDWVMGANLITREPARVEFFYEDGINVRENKVTVRIEERIAFPIYGDNYFIVGTFGDNS